MIMDKFQHNYKPKPDEQIASLAKLTSGQFYYMDKFLLLSVGSDLCLYKYALDLAANDLKRYDRRSRFKLVTKLPHPAAQSLTAFAAPTGFYS